MQSKQIADFIERADYESISSSARLCLKIRVLDSLGCAIGALGSDTIRAILDQIHEFGGAPLCSLIAGQRTSPDRAAFYNSADCIPKTLGGVRQAGFRRPTTGTALPRPLHPSRRNQQSPIVGFRWGARHIPVG